MTPFVSDGSPEGVTMKQRMIKRVAAAAAVTALTVCATLVPASSAQAADSAWPTFRAVKTHGK